MPDKENKNEDKHIILNHNIFINWKSQYNLGIPIIDEQHRGITTIINSLYFGIQYKYGRDILAPTVNMIHEYTRIHFQTEESFLEKIDFSSVEKHRELHNELLSMLADSGKQSKMDKNPIPFMNFLKNWWIGHICNEDLKYRNHLLALIRKSENTVGKQRDFD